MAEPRLALRSTSAQPTAAKQGDRGSQEESATRGTSGLGAPAGGLADEPANNKTSFIYTE